MTNTEAINIMYNLGFSRFDPHWAEVLYCLKIYDPKKIYKEIYEQVAEHFEKDVNTVTCYIKTSLRNNKIRGLSDLYERVFNNGKEN